MSYQDEIASRLSYFGLDSTDASLYLNLLQIGSVTAGTLSSRIGIDRGKTYRSLNKLRNLGLITTTLSNPTMCMALEPAKALTSILQRKEDEIITMHKLASDLTNRITNTIMRTPSLSKVPSFAIIQGRKNIYARIGQLIQDAKEMIYIVTTPGDILRMYHTSIPERIKACAKKGVEIKLLTQQTDEKIIPLMERLGTTEIRLGKLPSMSRIVVEKDRHLIMSGLIKDSTDLNDETDSVLYTDSSEMINNVLSLCSHLWKKARTLEVAKH